jgi:hypothetical protein
LLDEGGWVSVAHARRRAAVPLDHLRNEVVELAHQSTVRPRNPVVEGRAGYGRAAMIDLDSRVGDELHDAPCGAREAGVVLM